MNKTSKNKRRGTRGGQRRSRGGIKGFSVRRELSDSPAYQGQVSWRVRLPGAAVKLTTTVTTGVIANALQLTSADIVGFATRFGSTFDEYRTVGADVELIPLAASTGEMNFWFDEKSTAAPTSNEAQERTSVHCAINSAASGSHRTMRWRARDLLDLQYSPIGTLSQPVTFKSYTDNALFGATIVATDVYIVKVLFLIEFRGLKST